MTLLESINSPADLRALPTDQLRTVADEIRAYILETMSRVGGHTGASLGAVELAVALHYAFDTPHDRLVWDVGHQAYAHKILTGRRDLLPTIKQYGGISGFLRRDESEYDTFGAGHASTSLSAALGMAIAPVVALIALWDDRGSAAFVLTAIGLAIVVLGVYVVSNVWKEPLYDVMLAWDPDAMPTDWSDGRRRYLAINWIQTAATWTVFALFLAALIAASGPR